MGLFRKILLVVASVLAVIPGDASSPVQSSPASQQELGTRPADEMLAGRYYLRNRTNRFYQRSGRTGSRVSVG